MPPEEAIWYEQWRSDPDRPKIENVYSEAAAGWLSMAFPAAGFIYLGDFGLGFLAATFWLPLWPIGVPAIRAANEAERENKIHIARVYHAMKPYGWRHAGYAGGVNQNNNQNVNVNVSAPPVVNVTNVIQDGRPAGIPAAPTERTSATRAASYCSVCGDAQPEASRFCSNCGTAQRR